MARGKLLLLPSFLDFAAVEIVRQDLPAIIAAHEEAE